ncbi:hypothetical protein TpMuguga_01g02485 [Theileria parva strain Muguga]|uniref:uncharacterized protein n=1 Tax=Theileria parva strain Muguga TaxID=333668 RepID=UPI001C61982F|nr:uncharacterized protein TpMuguga_01g02485 [Theileria parva strain Muguga]KAF5153457.1 hypothetical protein TpMuguga_01g02485 [Theileria parva strain Muguga]
MDLIYSLDVTGETFSEPLEVDSEPQEDEPSINVKEFSDSKLNVLDEETKTIRIDLATHIRDLSSVNQSSCPELYEKYRKITMDIRKFIYNSIISEDFCVNFSISRGESSDKVEVDGKSRVNSDNGNLVENMGDITPEPLSSELKTAMSIDGLNEVMSIEMRKSFSPSNSVQSISSSSSLSSLKNENLDDIDEISPSTNMDCILLELSPTKLNRTVTEMAHVQMRRFFSSYPKSFKIATGNVGADVYAMGKRYYISSDSQSSDYNIDSAKPCHSLFLAHLYRRQRSICYYCGFTRCARSASSKNMCEFQKCVKCVGYHKWSRNSCKANGKLLEHYLSQNDWQGRRSNYWGSVPKHIRQMLRCFYCNNEGDANFKCQGLSCPEGNATLRIRCLELMGANELNNERRKTPQNFPHLKRSNFVFDKDFKVK